MSDFVAVSRFDRKWSPVSFNQLERTRRRDCGLTNVVGDPIRIRKPEEIV